MSLKSTLTALLIVTSLLVMSCSLIDPIIVRRIAECDPTSSSASGANCAAKLRSGYLEAVSNREMLNTATNVGILTLLTTFGILASVDAINAETIVAGGIGGAALLATPRLFGTDQRDFTYLAGAEAMTCVLDAARPALILVSDTGFLADVQTKRTAVLNSIDTLEKIDSGLPAEATTVVGQNVKTTLAEAKALYMKSGRLLRTLRTSDARVLNAARSIDTKVNTALVQQRTDPLALANSLGASTTLVQGQISQFLPQLPAPPKKKPEETSAPEAESAVANAKQRILDLEAVTDDMEQVVSPFESESLRKRCTIDSPDIRPFSTDPTHLTLPASNGSAPRLAKIEVTGGKASHTATLVGVLPPDPSTLIVSMEETRDGFARILVTATPALTGGTYNLRVAEKEGRNVTVPIVVVGSPPAPAPAPAPSPPSRTGTIAPERTKVAEVETLQKKLKALVTCTLKSPVPPGVENVRPSFDPGAIDGILGGDDSNTRRAITNLLNVTLSNETSPPEPWETMKGDVKSKATAVAQRVDAVSKALCTL
jgi:hypothetical protein